jgi:outer membrane lipoprotein-sorting protein
MKLNSQAMTLLSLVAGLCHSQSVYKSALRAAPLKVTVFQTASQTVPPAQSPATAAASEELKAVLAKMNQSAANFKSLQADFEWETFDKLIKETDVQRGQAYFRRKGNDLEALFNFNAASGGKESLSKQALYKDGKISLYEPRINRITEREVGKNKSDVDAFMSLGLGGRGDDLAASFAVTWQGWETVEGVKTAKLEVTGKSPSIQKVFSKAVLWIDPERDIAVKQQFFQSSGDYRLTRYHNIKFNDKVPESVFRLKTTGTPEIVHLHGD